ncbi:MAG: Sec-independent protein translocase subunit TatA/TatB [Bellilinea sp.]
MEIFGVGILEVILILVIAVIVLGPEGMVKAAQSIGRFMRKVIKSPIWAQLMDTQRELRDMPTRLVREAGLEEDIKELKKTQQELRNVDIKATAAKAARALVDEPTIAPPTAPTLRQAQGAVSPVVEPVEAPLAEPAKAPVAKPEDPSTSEGSVEKPEDESSEAPPKQESSE